jgi:acyl-CoA thioesterase FadM
MYEVLGATQVTVASGCSYLVPGRLHDRFLVRVRLDRVGTTSISLAFSVDHETEECPYAEGTMTLVFVGQANVDADERPRPVPVPEGMKRALRDAGCVL